MTETASSCTFNRPGDRKVLSIGKPLWGVRMRVADTAGRPLPSGREHVGEILIRGHNVMKGYLGRPEATAETLRDGWLHSGDLGFVDEDGFYFIVDRAKDLVIRGGYNVYPREIEEVLYAHPSVAEAAVIGKPDERLGEEVVAVVALRPGTSATARRSSSTPGNGWPRTSTRGRSGSWPSCPRAPPARSSRPPCATLSTRHRWGGGQAGRCGTGRR
jgi:long-chain acyl-CoA synthetase